VRSSRRARPASEAGAPRITWRSLHWRIPAKIIMLFARYVPGRFSMNIRVIWEQGIPLAEADIRFAQPDLRAAYSAVGPTVAPSWPEVPSAMAALQLIQRDIHSISERATIRAKMRDCLLKLLRDGQLFAYGFVVPRATNAEPTRVPTDLFEMRFLCKDSGIKGHGIEFAAVRVLHPQRVQEIEASAPKRLPRPAPETRGRKSVGDLIVRSVRSLLAEGKIDPDAPHKLTADLIRAHVHDHSPGEVAGNKGLSDETIRRVLVRERRQFSHRLSKSQK